MFYSLDILSMRKKGKLARCWLAATLSDRLFKKTVSNRIILSIDIIVTCNEILKVIKTESTNKKSRFSLYMSSQLMYGAVKLLKIQVTIFQESLFRIQTDLNPIDMAPKKTKKTGEATLTDVMTLAELPPVTKAFGDLHLRDDLHLMPEIDLETIRVTKLRDYVESPNFGALTGEELDFMLLNGGETRMCVSPDSRVHTIDESNEQPRSPGHTTELHDIGLSDALLVIEESATAETSGRLPRTPQKRVSNATYLDTPTKRLRRGLREAIDAAAEDRTGDAPTTFQVDVEVHQPLDGLVELPAHVEGDAVQPVDESVGLPPETLAVAAFPAHERTVDTTAPADSNLHLQTLESEIPRPGTRVRSIKRIDKNTQLPNAQTGKTQNPQVHTIRSLVPPVPERKRVMSAGALLMNPSTNRRRHRITDPSKWAEQLILHFEIHTLGPFVAEYDASISAEAIRLADSETQLGLDEISKRPGDTTGLEGSSRNKTADHPIAVEHDTIAGPMVPDMFGDVPEVPMDTALADITNEHMLQDISEAPEGEPLPEIEIPPIPQNIVENASEAATVSIANLPQSVAQESATTNGQSTSDPNTEDIDAFLPPKLRRKYAKQRASYEKTSAPEAIVDIRDSPASVSPHQRMDGICTKPELLAYLEVLWADRRAVRLQDLLPRDTTSRIDAAYCFSLLLELSKERKVSLRQTECYGTIRISKMSAARRSMDWDEA